MARTIGEALLRVRPDLSSFAGDTERPLSAALTRILRRAGELAGTIGGRAIADRVAATRIAPVTIDVRADDRKLAELERKTTALGTTATRAGLAQERAQLAVNKAQEKYNALLADDKVSQDARALALNRVSDAQARLEQASQRVADVERQRNDLTRQTDTVRQKVHVQVEVDEDVDTDRAGRAVTSAFAGIGRTAGGLLRKALGGGIETGVDVGRDAFRTLSQAGVSTAAAIGTALTTGVATTAATGGINLLIGALLLLAAAIPAVVIGFLALAPAIQLVAGAFGASLGAGFAFAGVLATVMLAFGGVMDVLKKYSAAQDQTTGSGARLASQERANAVAVRNATEAIADARRRQAEVAEQSAQRIRDAQAALARAQEDAADRIRAAQQRVTDTHRDAAERIAAAQEDVARAHEDAAERVTDAEEDLADATERSADAQQRLNDVRVEAQRRLEDLGRAARGAAVDEEEAQVRLSEAQEKLATIDASMARGSFIYTAADRRRAVLEVEKATNDLADAQQDAGRTQRAADEAARKGVEGDRQVVDAKEAAKDAADAQARAQTDLAQAHRDAADTIGRAEQQLTKTRRAAAQDQAQAAADLARAQRDAVRSVGDAERQLTLARRAGARAQADATTAVNRAVRALGDLKAQQADAAKTAAAGTSAATAWKKAYDKLTPAGQAFVDQVIRMKENLLPLLSATAQRAMLPGVTSFLKDSESLFPIVNAHIGNMGRILGDVFRRLGQFLNTPLFRSQLAVILGHVEKFTEHVGNAVVTVFPALVTIAEAASPLLEKMGGWLEDAATAFATWIEDARKSGDLKTFFDGVEKTFQNLWDIGGLVFAIIGDIIEILFPGSKDASDGVLDRVKAALQTIHEWLDDPQNQQKLRDWVQKLIDFIKKLDDFTMDVIILTATISGWFSTVDGWVSSVEAAKTKLELIWNGILRTAAKFGTALVTLFVALPAAIAAAIVALPTMVYAVLVNTYNTAVRTAGAVVGAVVAVFAGMGVRAYNALRSLPAYVAAAVAAAIGGAGSAAWSIGQNIMVGLAQGLLDTLSYVKSMMGYVIGQVISVGRIVLDIRSPSGVFRHMGRQSGQGYALGWQDQASDIDAAVSAALSPPTAGTAGVGGPGSLPGAGTGDELLDLVRDLIDAVNRVAPGVAAGVNGIGGSLTVRARTA